MTLIKNKSLSFLIINVMLLSLLALGFSNVVNASGEEGTKDINATLNITGESNIEIGFEEGGSINFGNFNLSEGFEISEYDKMAGFTVTDARGLGDGYTLQLKAGAFKNGEEEIPANDVKLYLKSGVEELDDEEFEQTKIGEGGYNISETTFTINTKEDGDGKGMGIHEFTFGEESLKLDADLTKVKQGEYTSTIVLTVVAGPGN